MQSIVFSTVTLLILIPVVNSVACFGCGGGGNCNDPFTSTSTSLASGVNITQNCGACVKTGIAYVISRYCASTCPTVSAFTLGTGVACCSNKDYCNGISSFYNNSFILLGLMSTILILRKINFV